MADEQIRKHYVSRLVAYLLGSAATHQDKDLEITCAVLVFLFGAEQLPDMARAAGQITQTFKGEIKRRPPRSTS